MFVGRDEGGVCTKVMMVVVVAKAVRIATKCAEDNIHGFTSRRMRVCDGK